MGSNLEKVANGLGALEALLPFVLGLIKIIRSHMAMGSDSIPISDITDLWQGSMDRVDAKGRAWLEEHGMEAPPPKPDAVPEED
jgi:hypothetical protein